MSPRDHETIEVLLALRALDGLDGDDVSTLDRLRAEHAGCAECGAIESGFARTAALLASSLAPASPPPGGPDEILRHARAVAPAPTAPGDELAARRATHARRWTVSAAAAAVIVLVAGSLAVSSRREQPATLAEWSQRVVRFDGNAGELAMAYVPGRPGVAFWGQDLPDPGAGKTFEIWMIDDGRPIPGGCVTPTDGSVAMYVDARLGTTDTMAVTVEPTTCPAEPTGSPVLSARL